jgi:hypothetical protein
LTFPTTVSKGWPGAEQATITGLVSGTILAISGRIWMLMVAHAAFDLTALAIIYWNLETKVAHLVFRSPGALLSKHKANRPPTSPPSKWMVSLSALPEARFFRRECASPCAKTASSPSFG